MEEMITWEEIVSKYSTKKISEEITTALNVNLPYREDYIEALFNEAKKRIYKRGVPC